MRSRAPSVGPSPVRAVWAVSGLLLLAWSRSLGLAQISHTAASQNDTPTFDAVSIKLQLNRSVGMNMRVSPAGLSATKVSMKAVIAWAYEFRQDRIIAAADWLASTEFDIEARTNRLDVPMSLVGEMIKSMLADRLSLRVHTEARPQPVYELVLEREGRLGPSLAPSTGCVAGAEVTAKPNLNSSRRRPCGTRTMFDRGLVVVEAGGGSMSGLVRSLQGTAGRAVIDKTGLTGPFDFELRYLPDTGDPDGAGDLPGVFTAVREQLGLALKPAQGLVEFLVVDSVQLPSQN